MSVQAGRAVAYYDDSVELSIAQYSTAAHSKHRQRQNALTSWTDSPRALFTLTLDFASKYRIQLGDLTCAQ